MTTYPVRTGDSVAPESLFSLALEARVEAALMWLLVTAREVGTEAFDTHRGNAWSFAERAGYLYSDEPMPNLLQDYQELEEAWEYGVARCERERRFEKPASGSPVTLNDPEAGFPAGTYYIGRNSSGDSGPTAEQVDEYVQLAGLIPYRRAGRCSCKCGSTEDVFVRPSYRDPKYFEYALCRACLSRTVCCITIGNVDAAPAPDMPSHLFPGCGSDGAEFTVTNGHKPSRDDVSDMLYEAIVDAVVVEYDETTGKGYFRVIDGEAPPVGTVIPLIAQAETDFIS